MERITRIEYKQQEGTAKPTKKVGKAGPKPWEIQQYIYTEPKDEKRPSSCDPRLELAQRIDDQHQDSDFIPYDDSGYGSPAFGLSATPDLNYSTATADELGTLAGGRWDRPITSATCTCGGCTKKRAKIEKFISDYQKHKK
jgi:hypothetical protein